MRHPGTASAEHLLCLVVAVRSSSLAAQHSSPYSSLLPYLAARHSMSSPDQAPYSQRPEWADLSPLPVTDDAGKVVAIQYDAQHKEQLGYFRAVLAKVGKNPLLGGLSGRPWQPRCTAKAKPCVSKHKQVPGFCVGILVLQTQA